MSEWKQVVKYGEMPMHRTGWLGAWDAILAAITKKPRLTVNEPVTFSVWVKTDQVVNLEIARGQVETGKIPVLQNR
jgi:hypothetical protein